MSKIFRTALIQSTIPAAMLVIPSFLLAVETTHLGVPVNDLVTLQVISAGRIGCGPAKFDVLQVLPDGTSGTDPFRIPEGRELVITEIDWYYFDGPPGATVILSVLAENLRDASGNL